MRRGLFDRREFKSVGLYPAQLGWSRGLIGYVSCDQMRHGEEGKIEDEKKGLPSDLRSWIVSSGASHERVTCTTPPSNQHEAACANRSGRDMGTGTMSRCRR
jgi:hypothetical protein